MVKRSTPIKENHLPTRNLLPAARNAESAYQWETAIDLYTQMLDSQPAGEEKFHQLKQRAACFDYLGEIGYALRDAQEMVSLSAELGDDTLAKPWACLISLGLTSAL